MCLLLDKVVLLVHCVKLESLAPKAPTRPHGPLLFQGEEQHRCMTPAVSGSPKQTGMAWPHEPCCNALCLGAWCMVFMGVQYGFSIKCAHSQVLQAAVE